jgi:hypothetical protein
METEENTDDFSFIYTFISVFMIYLIALSVF